MLDIGQNSSFCFVVQCFVEHAVLLCAIWEAAWTSGQRVGLAIRRSRVRAPLRPLAGFVLGRP